MSPSFSFANTREFDTSKTTPGSGATWNLVRRTFSLTYQLPPPVSRLWTECRRKQQQPDALSRLGLGISLDSGRPKVKIGGSRSPGWSSRGGWMWMCVVGWVFVGQFFGWLEWAGNLKHNVYVVLSCMDCVRRYWLPKQDFFGIYLPPHSTYSRDFEPREWVAHTVISSGVLGLFRISKEEDLVGTEGARFGFGTVCHEPRCWTNGSGFFLPLYAAIVSLTQQPGYACFIPSPRMDPSSGIIDTAARWGAIPLTGYRVPPTPWLLSEKSFFLFFIYFNFRFHPPHTLSSSCTLSDILRICTGPRNGFSPTLYVGVGGRTDEFGGRWWRKEDGTRVAFKGVTGGCAVVIWSWCDITSSPPESYCILHLYLQPGVRVHCNREFHSEISRPAWASRKGGSPEIVFVTPSPYGVEVYFWAIT